MNALDDAVHSVLAKLDDDDVPTPEALFLMATGADLFSGRLSDTREVELARIARVPEPWSGEILVAGRLGRLPVWLATDVSGDPVERGPAPPWTRGFPLWLAAAAGASVCVHTAAGCALSDDPAQTGIVGGFAFVRDHINLSGESPLIGLGESRLGPLFPDLSMLHHLGLRRAALDRAETLGLRSAETIAACTAGPSLETPAERRMLALTGAEVSVQGLAIPLLAAAHAGTSCLSIVAVTDAGADAADLTSLLSRAAESQPALDDLLVSLAPDIEGAVSVLGLEAER